MQLDLVVWRRGTDPAAETCAQALRDLMHVPVAGVQRSEMWRFHGPEILPHDAGDVRQKLLQAACRAGRYVNLNRDACGWFAGPRPYPDDAFPGGHVVDIWVRQGDGSDLAALEYFRDQGAPELLDVRRGTLWRLSLPDTDPEAARRRAGDIALTRSRRQGLLANPHAQSFEVLYVRSGQPSRPVGENR